MQSREDMHRIRVHYQIRNNHPLDSNTPLGPSSTSSSPLLFLLPSYSSRNFPLSLSVRMVTSAVSIEIPIVVIVLNKLSCQFTSGQQPFTLASCPFLWPTRVDNMCHLLSERCPLLNPFLCYHHPQH